MGRIVNALEGLTKYDAADPLSMLQAGIKPDFRIYTAGMETVFDVNQQATNTVRMVGSSTVQDLQGDTMHLNALNDMANMPPNMTVWLNHSYSLPDDIFGSVCEAPAIIHQGGIADLHLAVDTEMDNPRAAKVKRYIDNGRKLGCSIGCLVTKYEVPDPEIDGPDYYKNPIIIHGVYVMEYSVVGIPANQRSWVENAIKGVFLRTYDPYLASAMKSLWPNVFAQALVENPQTRTSTSLLEQVAVRPSLDKRLEWRPLERKHYIVSGTGTATAFNAEQYDHMRTLVAQAAATEPVYRSKMPVQELAELEHIETIEDWTAEWTLEYEPETVKGACGKTSWPLADKGHGWNGSAAKKRLNAWAGDNKGKLKSVYFWTDGQDHFKLPFCDVIGGSIKAVPHAIHAVAGSLGGSRSGLNVPDADKSAIRSKVATYYRRMGEKPPWASGDDSKAIEELYMEENGDIMEKVYALNADGSQGIEIEKATGNHASMTGSHSHGHNAFNHSTADANGQHSHVHFHRADNHHGHSHDGIESTDDQSMIPATPTPAAANPSNSSNLDAEPEVQKHEHVLEPSQASILAAANGLLKQLGLSEVTPEMVVHQQMASVKDVAVNAEHISHLQTIHDHATTAAARMGHSVCGGDGNYRDANGMSMTDATDQARMANGQDAAAVAPQMRSVEIAEKLAAALERVAAVEGRADQMLTQRQVELAKAELIEVRSQIDLAKKDVEQLVGTLDSMRNVRVPRPTQLARSVVPDEDGRAFYEDFLAVGTTAPTGTSLADEIKAVTTVAEIRSGNSRMRVRQWPDGALKGRRPPLTASQITYMTWDAIESYRSDKASEVPMIHDAVEG